MAELRPRVFAKHVGAEVLSGDEEGGNEKPPTANGTEEANQQAEQRKIDADEDLYHPEGEPQRRKLADTEVVVRGVKDPVSRDPERTHGPCQPGEERSLAG